MVDSAIIVSALQDGGVDFFTGVPDSLLKSFCAYVTDTCVVKKAMPPLLLHQWGPFEPSYLHNNKETS